VIAEKEPPPPPPPPPEEKKKPAGKWAKKSWDKSLSERRSEAAADRKPWENKDK